MKTFSGLSLLTIAALAFGLFGIQTSFADIIPDGEHWVDTCVKISSDFPDFQLLGYIKKVSGDSTTSPYIIKSGECLTKGYKGNYFYVFGHRGTDAINLDTASPESVFSDPIHFFTAYTTPGSNDLALNYTTVPDTNPLTKQTIEYSTLAINGKVALYKSKVTSEFDNGIPTKVETFPVPTDKDIFGFTDYDAGKYTQALQFIAQNKIAQGFSDGSFRPSQSITRAELLKIVLKSKKIFAETFANQKSCFSDVKETWHIQYTCAAKRLGIISGYNDGAFKPNQNISFIEALKIIERAYGATVANSNPWYKAYVEDASEKNIIPIDIRYFNQTLTRGQMADIIARYTYLNESKYTRDDYIISSFGSAGLKPTTYNDLSFHQ